MSDQVTTSLAQAKVLVMQGQKGDAGPAGSKGDTGAAGADGYSPVVTISSITGGHRVNITDKTHPSGQNFDVMDGEDGAVRLETSILAGDDVTEIGSIVRHGEETALYSADIYAMIQSNQLPYIRDRFSGDVYQLCQTENFIASAFNHEYTFAYLGDSVTKFLEVKADSYAYRAVQSGGGGGADGVSPEITITSVFNGRRIKITDKEHPQGQTFEVYNGTNGHSPYIDSTTGTWWYYDEVLPDWVDSGVAAGLPPVTAADNGKVLKVVNGVWTAVAE